MKVLKPGPIGEAKFTSGVQGQVWKPKTLLRPRTPVKRTETRSKKPGEGLFRPAREAPVSGVGPSTQGVAPAVLVPGGDEEADQGDRNQSEHDAAEEGFNHGESPQGACTHSFTAHSPLATVSRSVTGPSPLAASASSNGTPAAVDPLSPEEAPPRGRRQLALLTLVAGLAVLLFSLAVLLPGLRADPYTRATLHLRGDVGNGGRLFRLNCAGCHGLAAQGLVGPNLHGVGQRKNDRQLIQQVVSGRTPPMPRFQPDPQTMADLLAFLHSLP